MDIASGEVRNSRPVIIMYMQNTSIDFGRRDMGIRESYEVRVFKLTCLACVILNKPLFSYLRNVSTRIFLLKYTNQYTE